MTALFSIFIFAAGLCLGSFYNVVGLRVPRGESMIRPRSHCTQCRCTLSAAELIPLFSYLWLRGSCRGCGKAISPIYPLVELGTALLFAVMPALIGWSYELLVAWTLISLLVVICITDLRYMLIPDKVLLVFAILFLVLRIVFPLHPWWNMFVGAGLGFALLFVIAVASKGGMGGGDMKLFAVLGLVLGWKGILLAFFFSTLYGTLIGAVGIMLGKVRRGRPMPFGPFIALGAMTAYLWGEELIAWYFQFLMT
ncbi:A24 family peptidase [Paenibacillus sp. MSJ-34]|uniref:prepilin peptidase n=1 Tax=Paenibacillus sp. MSJ-34 TaxID=2841529 RepID=UPI001C11E4AD|nr:A24 family peptidase [Paenibacillus sp. MSJ-34]MBU5444986.1 prepilin peptidase [Paenibacillus sp. MSJ-34]